MHFVKICSMTLLAICFASVADESTVEKAVAAAKAPRSNLEKQFGAYQKISEIKEISEGKGLKLFNARCQFEKGAGRLALTIDESGKVRDIKEIPDVDLPQLDKTQMLDDFDFMVAKLRATFPLAKANQELFGLDVWAKLAEYRAKITGTESPVEYAKLIGDALMACKGNHLWISAIPRQMLKNPIIKELYPLSEREFDTALSALTQLSMLELSDAGPFRLKYHDGKFYSGVKHTHGKQELPYGSELMSIDGKSPQELLPLVQDKLNRYDFKHRIFYGVAFNNIGDNFYAVLNQKFTEFTFKTPTGETVTLDTKSDKPLLAFYPSNSPTSMPKAVHYFPAQKILYIRIPQMNQQDIPFYEKNIIDTGKDKEIRAVVLDVRFNPGGSDLVWMKILGLLTAENITYRNASAALDSPEVRAYTKRHVEVMRKIFPGTTGSDPSKVDEMVGEDLPYLGDGKFLLSTGQGNIAPAENSLKLTCPIYLIVEDIYSSAGGLLAVANRNDSMISVGFPSPVGLGKGIDPLQMALPNSGLIFSVEINADISDCKTAADTFHGNVEVPVEMTGPEFVEYWNTDTGKDRTDWLLTKDPFMRKVLELIAKQ